MGDYISLEWSAGRADICIQSKKTNWQLEVAHTLTNGEIDRVRDLEKKYNDALNQLLKEILDEASKNATE